LKNEKEKIFRILLETNFRANLSDITLVPDPHVTLQYLNSACPESFEEISRSEELFLLSGRRLTVEVNRAVFVNYGICCLEVEISDSLDGSVHPAYPHVTVCVASPFKAQHSNYLLRLAKLIGNQFEFRSATPNGELSAATGNFVVGETTCTEIYMWKNIRADLKLKGEISSFY
jgi:hypothetical protein